MTEARSTKGGHSSSFGAPGVPSQQTLKGDAALQEKTATKDYELDERKHQNRFRWLSLIALPVLATAWLGLIAWATLTGVILGTQVGIALGATGAGLLTLLGLQVKWAHSRKDEADGNRRGRVVEILLKNIPE